MKWLWVILGGGTAVAVVGGIAYEVTKKSSPAPVGGKAPPPACPSTSLVPSQVSGSAVIPSVAPGACASLAVDMQILTQSSGSTAIIYPGMSEGGSAAASVTSSDPAVATVSGPDGGGSFSVQLLSAGACTLAVQYPGAAAVATVQLTVTGTVPQQATAVQMQPGYAPQSVSMSPGEVFVIVPPPGEQITVVNTKADPVTGKEHVTVDADATQTYQGGGAQLTVYYASSSPSQTLYIRDSGTGGGGGPSNATSATLDTSGNLLTFQSYVGSFAVYPPLGHALVDAQTSGNVQDMGVQADGSILLNLSGPANALVTWQDMNKQQGQTPINFV